MKNVLLAVIGLSPQVLTETLFALNQQGKTIDEIQVITTRQGKKSIASNLLMPDEGMYYRYLDEYKIDNSSLSFGFDHVHTVKNDSGIEFDDITNEDENECFLKTCLEFAYDLTSDPATTVFFSIAGGRKTMSACLMAAAQFYGRTQDRVYHVLISPEFENCHDFYYPPRESRPFELKDPEGQPYIKESRFAKVTLVQIPFVSLRSQLASSSPQILQDPAQIMQSVIKDPHDILTLNLQKATLTYKNREIDMMPARLALYAFFALEKKNCGKQVKTCRNCTDCYLGIDEIISRNLEIADLYQKISKNKDLEAMSDTGILGLDMENFNSYKGKIRKDIEQGFGLYNLPELTITATGKRPDTRYGLMVDRDKICIIS